MSRLAQEKLASRLGFDLSRLGTRARAQSDQFEFLKSACGISNPEIPLLGFGHSWPSITHSNCFSALTI